MCNKADNSCRQEKLGCKGCFYERKSNYNDLLNTLIHTDFLDSANEYKKAIKQLINENVELLKKNKELEEKLKIAKQLYNDACVCIATECVEKDKIKEKLINDIKGINEKLYSKEYINLYRTYRLKGMKTKCKELLEFLESEE